MLNWIIDFSLRNRLLVCLLAVALVVIGAWTLNILPIDAFPDTTPVQVQVNTTVPSLNPEETEAQITLPVELAIGGLPGLQNIRSISKFGLSQVVATFDDGTSVFQARQLIMERLQTVELPEGVERPQLGPIATGLGEVFHYLVRSEDPNRTLTELREMHDWVVKPELRKVPGVAELNSWGGFEKQYHVVVETERLIKYGLTFEQLVEALQANNQNVGGGQVVRSGESLLVHGIGLTTNVEEIGDIVIAARESVPVRVRDVAKVQIDHEIRRGAVTADGQGEAVLGLGFMLMGENSAAVTHALKAKLAEVQRFLPADVKLEVLYDRTELVENVIHTVRDNLMVGALLVIAVLLGFLGSLRAGLIVAAAIPLSMLFAGHLMLQAGIAASLLSLGAIDFGLIVDSSVIMVENCARYAAHRKDRPWLDTIRSAALEVRKPTMFGELIIMIVFLPVLTLEGIEGKLFRPMALTMIFALVGSLVLSLTLMPVLASLLLPRTLREREPLLVRVAKRIYAPILDLTLRLRAVVLLVALALVAGGAFLALQMGGEFLPRLGEGAIVGTTVRLAGISVEESVAQNDLIERHLLAEFPDEIEHIWTRLGTAEVATDPMGVELADFFLALKPRAHWTKARTQAELTEKMREVLGHVPGMRPAFSQPIEMRMNELIAGIRGDIGIKVYGDNLDELRRLGGEVQAVLAGIPGASEVSVEQLTGQTFLQVHVDPQATARFGIPTRHVLNVVEAVGTRQVGDVREGQRRFPLVVRLPDRQRSDPQALANTLIPTEAGPIVALNRVARIVETEGPATINREWGRRRITVQCNVRGRDVAGFVAQARQRIDAQVQLPEGYSIEWGGQFENMERANRRLMFVVPMALALIFVLLFFSLGSLRDVLIVASGIPLGLVGGVLGLWLRGMPFTVSSAIGFVALSGVAILNGLVLVTFIRQKLETNLSVVQAVREGCLVRLRPVLMTALVAAVGFLPMAVNVGIGGEVQRPLATVVIGGIFSNTLLTLLVLPALYVLAHRRQEVDTRRVE
ncbi:MAG: CusA/CzcA family heavy metal efflux RND transporter [Planctomycetes bacterium]|jgi:cobalt-zinc-cadmium resistance protein CzcA|nr:CusA/CzcA family heavy metal efflux RND transporter [Planctomycetota bacterium]